MSTIEYEYVNSWKELSSKLDEYFTHYNNYIFRGQADSEWKSESTLTRALKDIYKKPSDRRKATIEHFRQFKENIRGRTNLDINIADDDEIWALGQHFGLNTPLLDWSRSPYVALFFSLFGPCKSGRRVLWAVFETDVDDISRIKKKASNKIKVVNPLTHYNERLVTQRGLFLNIPIETELETWIEKGKKFKWITMYKITYPDSIRQEALSALNNKNINHLSLFPDLNGSSLFSNYQLDIEPYLEESRQKLWK